MESSLTPRRESFGKNSKLFKNSFHIVEEEVDIFNIDDVTPENYENIDINLGDLHANTIKLIYLLHKAGMVEGLTKKVSVKKRITTGEIVVLEDEKGQSIFDSLVSLYKNEELTEQNLTIFEALLEKIKFEHKNNHIRFLGDVLADRGTNDYLTLIVLKKMVKENIPFTIVMSNHDEVFLRNFYNLEMKNPKNFRGGQGRSLDNLASYIENVSTRSEQDWAYINAIVFTCYLPNLKLIDYNLTDDKSNITLFTHGVVGLETIKAIAEDLEIKYVDSSPLALASVIDEINYKFSQKPLDYIKKFSDDDSCYWKLIWKRSPWEEESEDFDIPIRPLRFLNKAGTLLFCHGHDSGKCLDNRGHIINLDNGLGKYYNGEHYNEESLTLLLEPSSHNKLVLENSENENNKIEEEYKYIETALIGSHEASFQINHLPKQPISRRNSFGESNSFEEEVFHKKFNLNESDDEEEDAENNDELNTSINNIQLEDNDELNTSIENIEYEVEDENQYETHHEEQEIPKEKEEDIQLEASEELDEQEAELTNHNQQVEEVDEKQVEQGLELENKSDQEKEKNEELDEEEEDEEEEKSEREKLLFASEHNVDTSRNEKNKEFKSDWGAYVDSVFSNQDTEFNQKSRTKNPPRIGKMPIAVLSNSRNPRSHLYPQQNKTGSRFFSGNQNTNTNQGRKKEDHEATKKLESPSGKENKKKKK